MNSDWKKFSETLSKKLEHRFLKGHCNCTQDFEKIAECIERKKPSSTWQALQARGTIIWGTRQTLICSILQTRAQKTFRCLRFGCVLQQARRLKPCRGKKIAVENAADALALGLDKKTFTCRAKSRLFMRYGQMLDMRLTLPLRDWCLCIAYMHSESTFEAEYHTISASGNNESWAIYKGAIQFCETDRTGSRLQVQTSPSGICEK